jgi:hypothetical protein
MGWSIARLTGALKVSHNIRIIHEVIEPCGNLGVRTTDQAARQGARTHNRCRDVVNRRIIKASTKYVVVQRNSP